jgi:protein involved in polysaccharide export with SLBB domain
MSSIPAYRVAPPDILLIEAVNNIRPPNDVLRVGDQLTVRIANGLPLEVETGDGTSPDSQMQLEFEREFKFINRSYLIQPTGAIDLGPDYGSIPVAGLTVDEAKSRIQNYLRDATGLPKARVSVSLEDVLGRQAISGEHLVRPDGTVSLGIYGSVYVSGMTVDEVKATVEDYLSRWVLDPEVTVDLLSLNSAAYYVVMDGGGAGERVVKLPYTGNETVLDAIAEVEGLSEVSSKRMWVARPAPAGTGYAQVLPVNWNDIAAEGVTDTNYQLFPGDRLYVQSDPMVGFDTLIGKITSPLERVFGVTLLGVNTGKSIRFYHVFRPGFGGGVGAAP